MSRLIVKNLPQSISQKKVKEIFQAHGTITDLKLSYTKNGIFRRFGFIGYRNADEASKAKKYLNNSMLLNQKIKVEDCNDLQQFMSKVASKKPESASDETKSPKKESPQKEQSDLDFLKTKKSDSNNTTLKGNDCSENFQVKLILPNPKLSQNEVTEFIFPIKPKSVEITKSSSKSTAIVTMSSKTDCDKVLKFDGDCIKGKGVKVVLYKDAQNGHSGNLGGSWKKKIVDDKQNVDVSEIAESGRLFVRNLAFVCNEDDLEKLFNQFGPLSETHIPIDTETKKNMGIGFITYMMPEHAMTAFNKLDGSIFQGRMIHVLPAKSKPENESSNSKSNTSSYQRAKDKKDKAKCQHAYNWNTLFIGTDAVAGAIAEKYNITKNEFLNADEKGSAAVRLALGETQIVQETRQFLVDNGISLDSFSQPNSERSKCVMLAKNLPPGATALELRNLFEPHGDLGRVLLAPSGVTAVIEFLEPAHARKAFVSLAYRKFHLKPLYLEWASTDIFCKSYEECKAKTDDSKPTVETEKPVINQEDSTTIFVKNLKFETTEATLREHFCMCGEISSCTISKKISSKNEVLSMGYGFVQFYKRDDAENAIKKLQGSLLDGHALELKMSKRTLKNSAANLRKKQVEKKTDTGKILIRNVPFQADQNEIRSLFKTFGELKSVRLPKKLKSGGMAGSHRGFAFVDFITKQDAEKAFQALCHSTHLYGRRLVLEWADTEEENIESLRRKASEVLHGSSKRLKTRDDFEMSLASQKEKQ